MNHTCKANHVLTYLLICSLTSITLISGLALSSSTVSADDIVDNVSITVPIACTMSGTGMDTHTKEVVNGTYEENIGTTTMKVLCNDNSGFSIYATGFTNETIGETNSNKLVGTNASGNATIDTGIAQSGNTSNWAMKLATNSQATYPITITSDTEGPFSTYHTVPNEYTKVATRLAGTDIGAVAEGSTITSTYAAYINSTQPADTYTGKVKYTLVHPNDAPAPIANPAVLDTGRTVNSKLKSVAATEVNGEETIITPTFDPDTEDLNNASDSYVKTISVHTKTATPTGFIPTEMNTISASTSKKPIYAIFDNTNDAGIMHLYTEGGQIVLSSDSSFMFYLFLNLSDLSALSEWDTSNVVNMSCMFTGAGESATTFTLDLSSWNTDNVTNMNYMFGGAGESATTFTLDLSSWNTDNVTDMSYMFFVAGDSATTFTLNLSGWNTSNVTNMGNMFDGAGYYASTFTLDLSGWNTSNVTDMSGMFSSAGSSASTFTLNLSGWNTSNVTNMSYMFSYAGYYASTFTLDLSSWDTSNVTDMSGMFSSAGYSATTWSVGDLSSWDTSSVTNMSNMFSSAGYSATTFTLDLSGWNTSNVTDMSYMFNNAGSSATTWSVTIPQTNGGGINNTTSYLYGQDTSVYGEPYSGKSFTLAQ